MNMNEIHVQLINGNIGTATAHVNENGLGQYLVQFVIVSPHLTQIVLRMPHPVLEACKQQEILR